MWMRLAKIDLEVEGGEDLDPKTSYVVVANHLSNYDIMICFLAVPVPIRFLAKTELFKYPFLSHAMRAIGCVEVDRAAHTKAVALINEQAALVRSRNHSLLVYAEGTRSRDGELKAFKKGAFAIASGSGMPILPVGIIGSRNVVPPGTIKVKCHQKVTVRMGTPITDTADRPISELRDQIHAAVAELIS
jgi:1-acyl-sn-glycerol-3-phosphate acyltransferase